MAIWNMIARLTMDSTAFDRNSKRSKQSLTDLRREAESLSHVFGRMRLGDFAKGTLAFMGVQTSARMIGRGVRDFFAEAAQQSPTATAEMEKFSQSVADLSASLQRTMMPFINDFSKGLGVIARGLDAVADRFDRMSNEAQLSAESMAMAREEYRQITGDMNAFRPNPRGMSGPWGTFSPDSSPQYPEKWKQILDTYKSGLPGYEAPGGGLTKDAKAARDELQKLDDALDRHIYVVGDMIRGNEHANELMEYSIVLERAYADDIETQTKLYEKYKSGLEDAAKLKAKLAEMNKKEKEAAKPSKPPSAPWDGYGDDVTGGIRGGLARLKRELGGLGDLSFDLTIGGIRGISASLTDAILDAKSLDDALREVGRSMARMVMEWSLNQFVTSGLSSLMNSGSAGNGVQAPMVAPPIGGRAGGGRVSASHGYWVGENGPEWFSPDTGGAILPGGAGGAEMAAALGRIEVLLARQGERRMMILDRRQGVTRDEVAGVIIDDLDHGGPVATRLGQV